ncbi:MAG: signal peptidase II [Clostridia bacterium]|nr:signal peptidase II [Clostridia bacterium]
MKNIIKNNKFYIIIVAIFVLGLALDLITKIVFANQNFDIINGVLSVYYTQNSGAGFSLFSDYTFLLTIFSAIILIGLVVFNIKFKPNSKLFSVSMGLIFAGAVGNFLDRVFLGSVRDFIRFDFINFPIFNLADCCLTIGAVLLCVFMLFVYKEKK